MTLWQKCAAAFGANPFRQRERIFIKLLQYLWASAELALLFLPLYARRFRKSPKPALMVIGAQKSGTTWLDRELRRQGLARLPHHKETHHFDRGRMWSLARYLRGFGGAIGPLIEVAPDYGPLPIWRIRAIQRLCPDLKLVFVAREPAARLWSGVRMETGFDRGPHIAPSVFDRLQYLVLPRARKYADYATQIQNWQRVFGPEAIKLIDFETLQSKPLETLNAVLAHAGADIRAETVDVRRAFSGETVVLGEALAAAINREAEHATEAFRCAFPSGAPMAELWKARPLRPDPEARRRLFVLCGFNPSDQATSSGQKLAYRQIVELSKRFASVHVLAFRNSLDALDHTSAKWPANVTIEVLDLKLWHRLWGAIRHPSLPFFVSARRSCARSRLPQIMASAGFTDYAADFSQGLGALPERFLPLFSFRQHDVVSKLYARRAEQARPPFSWIYRIEERRAERWETRVWASCFRIETLSPEDALVIAPYARAAVVCRPPKGTLLTLARSKPVPGRIVFWGNMARAENEDAALKLIDDLLPSIRETNPAAHVWIVGAHPSPRLRAKAGPFVHVTGFVEDPVPILSSAVVAAAPLRLGSGVKIKVIETLDLGIPTVVSPVGGEGIPDHPHLWRVRTDQEMIKRIEMCLAHNVPDGYSATEVARIGRPGLHPAATATPV